jgi:hypothetical protein
VVGHLVRSVQIPSTLAKFFNFEISGLADRFLMEIEENVNLGTEQRHFSKIPFENRNNMQSQMVVCYSRNQTPPPRVEFTICRHKEGKAGRKNSASPLTICSYPVFLRCAYATASTPLGNGAIRPFPRCLIVLEQVSCPSVINATNSPCHPR